MYGSRPCRSLKIEVVVLAVLLLQTRAAVRPVPPSGPGGGFIMAVFFLSDTFGLSLLMGPGGLVAHGVRHISCLALREI